MSTGHFQELDALVTALADRYRTHGPPTLLYVTLAMLGYSALFQGKVDEAEQLFDESASIDVPDRTSSVNEPARARAAFRRGHQSQAFRILRSYVDDLLETDYTDLARNVAIEFINMMAAVGRLLTRRASSATSPAPATSETWQPAGSWPMPPTRSPPAPNARRTSSRLPDPSSTPGKHSSTCATPWTNLTTRVTPLDCP